MRDAAGSLTGNVAPSLPLRAPLPTLSFSDSRSLWNVPLGRPSLSTLTFLFLQVPWSQEQDCWPVRCPNPSTFVPSVCSDWLLSVSYTLLNISTMTPGCKVRIEITINVLKWEIQ